MKPLLLLLLTALCSCNSTGGKDTPPLMSQNMASRLTKPDFNKRSIYDKSMQATLNNKTDTGAWFGRQKHNAKMFTDTKAFSQTPEFKTSSYSRTFQKSHMGSQSFQQSDKVSRDASSTFSTSPSRFAEKTSRDAGKAFSGANDTFKTTSNRDALKSQQKNDVPEFIKLDEQNRKPAYTEDEVRKLMGRN